MLIIAIVCIGISVLGTIIATSYSKDLSSCARSTIIICNVIGGFGAAFLSFMNYTSQGETNYLLKQIASNGDKETTNNGGKERLVILRKNVIIHEKDNKISGAVAEKLDKDIHNAIVNLTGQGAEGKAGPVSGNYNVTLPSIQMKATLNAPMVSDTSKTPKSVAVPLTPQGAQGKSNLSNENK
jgi:hypothetical protein